jgi:hypothetical protein
LSAFAISATIAACIFAGGLLGFGLRRWLPEHHLATESKDLVKLGTGLIGTMAALVLGLMVASAKGAYDAQKAEVIDMSAKIAFLDRILHHYGSETQEVREALRRSVNRAIEHTWTEKNPRREEEPMEGVGAWALHDKVQGLRPQDDAQRALKAQALGIVIDLGRTRWLMFEQETSSSISVTFLVVVVFWLTIIFLSFGLFAPPNATVITTLLLSALSVSGAIFLVLELDRPFDGLIQISSAPMEHVLEHLGH